ncbi:MDR family MFS transporter [Bacillus licheniformis]|uniref:MDR family MFS transporter n=1 Tax=Bacillus licheniformis TaxID=1402 RepID=UPI0011A1092F|nr:MFS transporter [Bacillus licheniformis]TWN82045.1 Multidrug resistance protein MdtH [Bacillus licheniformis]
MFAQFKAFSHLHPLIRFLLIGTLVTKAAKSMTTPFLALYLHMKTGADFGTIGLVIGLGYFSSTVGGVVGGALSDKIGRKKVMLSSIFIWSFVFILFGLVHDFMWFLLLNILSGLCHSCFEPVSKALMAELSEREMRFRIFSLRYLAINVGAAVGPLLGAYFGLAKTGTPFIITGLVYFGYAILLSLMMIRLTTVKETKIAPEKVQAGSVLKTLKQDKALRLYIAGGILFLFSYSQMESTLLQYLNNDFANGVKIFSTLITLNAVTVILLQVPLTRLFERYKSLTTISIGTVFCILGNIGFSIANGWIVFMLSMFVLTIGEILCFPSMNVLLDELAPDHMKGAYYGMQNLYNIGEFLGPWLGGMMLALYGGKAVFLIAACSVFLALGAYHVGRRKFLSAQHYGVSPFSY